MNINRNHIIKIFPKYIKTLELINKNPIFYEFMRNNEPEKRINTDRFEMFDYVIEQIKTPIDFFEFGVFKGDVIKYWAQKINGESDRFFGFDSFEGLPENYDTNHPRGSFTTNGNLPQTEDHRIEFSKGWFNDTLPEFLKSYKSNTKIIHMDADLYSSTLFVLTQMHAHLIKGDIIIFDEFGNLLNEFRAWCDYTSAYQVKFKTLVSFRNFGKVAFRII